MLLSNVTAAGSACTTLLSLKVSVLPDPKSPMKVFPVDSRSGSCPAPVPYPAGEPKEVLALPLLLDAFVKAARVTDDPDPSKHQFKGQLHFLASVFANMSSVNIAVFICAGSSSILFFTQVSAGRSFFVTPRSSDPLSEDGDLEYPLSKLLAFTEHKDMMRRGGVGSTIKYDHVPCLQIPSYITVCPAGIAHFKPRHTVLYYPKRPRKSQSRLQQSQRPASTFCRTFCSLSLVQKSTTLRYVCHLIEDTVSFNVDLFCRTKRSFLRPYNSSHPPKNAKRTL